MLTKKSHKKLKFQLTRAKPNITRKHSGNAQATSKIAATGAGKQSSSVLAPHDNPHVIQSKDKHDSSELIRKIENMLI